MFFNVRTMCLKWYVPAGQFDGEKAHSRAPIFENVPRAHSRHAAAPVTLLKRPYAQGMHLDSLGLQLHELALLIDDALLVRDFAEAVLAEQGVGGLGLLGGLLDFGLVCGKLRLEFLHLALELGGLVLVPSSS